MNFLAKPPHAYNYFLQLSAFPQQLAAAQIMFALNTAQRLRHSFVELQKGGDLRLRKWVWAFELHFCISYSPEPMGSFVTPSSRHSITTP